MKRVLWSIAAVIGFTGYGQAQLPFDAASFRGDSYNKDKVVYYDSSGREVGTSWVDNYSKDKVVYDDSSGREVGTSRADSYNKDKTVYYDSKGREVGTSEEDSYSKDKTTYSK